MSDTGFALDVDLDLVTDDAEEEICMIDDCGQVAVMHGITTIPCGCVQPLCLYDYERNLYWEPGDTIWCYKCKPHTEANAGEFVRWEKIKR